MRKILHESQEIERQKKDRMLENMAAADERQAELAKKVAK